MSIALGVATADTATAFSEESTHVSGRRYVAHLFDSILYTIVFVATILAADFALSGSGVESGVFIVVLIAMLTVGHVGFLVLIHGKSGRSPGKRLTRIRVVDRQGNPPDRSMMWKRFLPVIIEYFYVIAWIGMMASPHRQRFGDRWAKTYVIGD